jgi:hypothetical protein
MLPNSPTSPPSSPAPLHLSPPPRPPPHRPPYPGFLFPVVLFVLFVVFFGFVVCFFVLFLFFPPPPPHRPHPPPPALTPPTRPPTASKKANKKQTLPRRQKKNQDKNPIQPRVDTSWAPAVYLAISEKTQSLWASNPTSGLSGQCCRLAGEDHESPPARRWSSPAGGRAVRPVGGGGTSARAQEKTLGASTAYGPQGRTVEGGRGEEKGRAGGGGGERRFEAARTRRERNGPQKNNRWRIFRRIFPFFAKTFHLSNIFILFFAPRSSSSSFRGREQRQRLFK